MSESTNYCSKCKKEFRPGQSKYLVGAVYLCKKCNTAIYDDARDQKKLYVIDAGKRKGFYTHECVMCGACCRGTYDISVKEEDIERWEREGRMDILNEIQIDQESLAPVVGFGIGLSDPLTAEQQAWADEIKEAMDTDDPLRAFDNFIQNHEDYFENLRDFIATNHEMINDGQNPSVMEGSIRLGMPLTPHAFIPGVYTRAIFRPNSFSVIKEGFLRHIEYRLINELNKERVCGFLGADNKCEINDTKPDACTVFPVIDGSQHYLEKALSFCKGFHKISPPGV